MAGAGCAGVWAQPRPIDAAKSTLTVRAYKSGLFSALGHDHEIHAPIAEGSVDAKARKVELQVKAGALRVYDPKGSQEDREKVEKTMLGPEVLDVERHPEIRFRSSGVEPGAENAWNVRGELTLHGATHPVTVEVHERDGHYVGSCRFKQTEFGMKPVKVAGGTVRVKDEVRIEFDIQLAH